LIENTEYSIIFFTDGNETCNSEKVLFKELGLLKEFFDKIKAEMGI
jgi:hypothetical protein